MSKYIINNCPCYNNERFIGGFLDDKATFCTYYGKKCQGCTDCKLKQIVEKCKKYVENYNDKVFYDEDDVKILMGKVMLSQSILSEILDIQEISDEPE